MLSIITWKECTLFKLEPTIIMYGWTVKPFLYIQFILLCLAVSMSPGILTCKKMPSLASDIDGFQNVFPVLALPRGGTKEDNKNKRIAILESVIKNIHFIQIKTYI